MAIQKLSTAAGAGSTIPVAGRYAAVSGGTVTTYSSGGLTYQVQTFTASGTLTVSNSGMVDILVVGGGAAGGPFYYYTPSHQELDKATFVEVPPPPLAADPTRMISLLASS